jgi:hypothetical protein
MVLLQFSWRRGSKDSRGQGFKCLFSSENLSSCMVAIKADLICQENNRPNICGKGKWIETIADRSNSERNRPGAQD